MQLLILVKKDLRSLFKQKAVIASLFIPMVLMISFGAIPLLTGIEQPFKVTLYNDDQGFNNLTLGYDVQLTMISYFGSDPTLKLVIVDSWDQFIAGENGVWFPRNFSEVAQNTSIAQYYMKMSDSNLRADSVMSGIVQPIIEQTVTRELIKPTPVPQIIPVQVYSPKDISQQGKLKERGKIAFPLAYMVFLLLILSGSSIRSTGFTNEKNSGMMELLLANVKNRRDLILSKIITALTYGFLTILSYLLGGLIGLWLTELSDATNSATSEIFFSKELVSFQNMFYMFILFFILIFISVQILLLTQLWFGKEAGDRIGSMVTMVFSFVFYFSLITDPLAQSYILFLNPFFWAYRATLNLIFHENPIATTIYLILCVLFSYILLQLKVELIQKERVIYD